MSVLRIGAAPLLGFGAMVAIAAVLGTSAVALAGALVAYVLVTGGAERLLFPDDFRRISERFARRLGRAPAPA